MPTKISEFKIAISDSEISDLQQRLRATRWPDGWAAEDWSRGVPSGYLKQLVEYWAGDYNWRSHEGRLNGYPQFVTRVDGQQIHFLHIRSRRPKARPLLLLHGYPSTFVDFEKIIAPLSDPSDDSASAYDLVIPSLPGYGFSTPLAGPGWEVTRTARAIGELMRRLGHDKYLVHAFDIGAGVAEQLAIHFPDDVVAFHVSTDPGALALLGLPLPGSEDDAEIAHLRAYATDGAGYLRIQGTRPQTLAYGLTDSPVAQLAWIVEKYKEWTNPARELPQDAVDIDQLLTSVCIYWFTRSGYSAAQFIYEAQHAERAWGAEPNVPAGYALFGAHPVVREVIDPERKIQHWSEFSEGRHFPAMEEPERLVQDLRRFFDGLAA
jgi:pimeloyl-ACP methyl ester carboxylesterase